MISTNNNLCKKNTFITIACSILFFTLSAEKKKTNNDTNEIIDKTVNVQHEDSDKINIESENPFKIEQPDNENKPTEKTKLNSKTTIEDLRGKKIRKIIVKTSGDTSVPESTIMSRIPYKKGELFNPNKTRKLIHNLYYDLRRFKNITVEGDLVDSEYMDLYILIEGKTKLGKVEFKGNSKVSEKEIRKKIDFSDIPTIEEKEAELYAKKIQKTYAEKNYHRARVTSDLKIDNDGQGLLVFNIKEGKKSLVKRVRFVGNKNISSKELRGIIFTREDWALGFLDNAGSYQPRRIEGDKHIIEQYYQNRGYMMAKVIDVEVKENPKTKHFDITFEIQEGELFKFDKIKASGHEILKDDYIISRLPVQEGDLYSRENIIESIKALEGLWGELGYIYVDVNPSIQPNEDTKTVKVAFHTDLGNKIFLNKINIIGNKKSYDKVIRRKLLLSEGQLLTDSRMEMSKHRVESLGYFDQKDGVIWRKVRVDDEHADLDLILKEIKTGTAHLKIGFGGAAANMKSPGSGFSISAEIADRNLFGSGRMFTLNASWAKEEQNILFNITDPWMFDLPLTGALDVYHRRPHYDEFKHTRSIAEKLTGAGGTVGFVTPVLWDSQVIFRLGIDKVNYENRPIAKVYDAKNQIEASSQYQNVLDKLFVPGKFFWLEGHIGMDRRNHPMHPSRGYKWLAVSRFGIPSFDCNIGFYKFDIDAHWFTPLIGEHDLVLHLRGYLGLLVPFSGRSVPYRELFHIGGPATVRGFLFGQAGPQFLGDSIGGKKAFCASAELSFPITDLNMKGVAFYDAGAGWDSPYACDISNKYLRHNCFDFRHSVGVGIRMVNPMPIRIDWGFKLNRKKKWNESKSEVHFGMSYDF